MPHKPPSWWFPSGRDGSFFARALHPLGLLYGELVKLRWRAQTPYCSSLPVICIGNFVAGGAGKTPLAIAVANRLKDWGETPYFLSRGYGGRISGPHFVQPDQDLAAAVGDEPLLLARHAPTVVAHDRKAGALFIEEQSATIVVMDDGFQNPALAKDLSLIAVDSQQGLGNKKIIPAGPLRAPLAFQREIADAIIVLGDNSQNALRRLADAMSGLPIMSGRIVPHGDTEWLSGSRVIAFAGIGRPEKFFTTLRELDAEIGSAHTFPDHHVYSDDDAKRLLTLAGDMGLPLVTTEKDWVRMHGRTGSVGTLRDQTRTVAIEIALEQASEDQLDQLIKNALRAKERLRR